MAGRRRSILSVFTLLLCLAVPASAQNKEVEAARKQVQELVKKGRALRAEGNKEKAQALLQKAEDIQAKLNAYEKRQGSERRDSVNNAERILHGLNQGMESLRKLRKMDALDILERITADYKRELGQRRERRGERDTPRRERRGERDTPRRERSEIEQVKHEIEILGLARAATAESGNERLTKMLDLAIRARKLGLEGRRDAEARKIRETSPDTGNLAELLMHAAQLYKKWGHEERAHVVGGLAEQFVERARGQRRNRGRGERREGERERNREREHGEREGNREREHDEREGGRERNRERERGERNRERERGERNRERERGERGRNRERGERNRERERGERGRNRERGERERGERNRAERSQQQMRQLEAQIKELGAALRRLQEQLGKVRR